MKLQFYIIILGIASCTTKPSEWKSHSSIDLGDVTPIGIAVTADKQIWISDGDHNRLVSIDTSGNISKNLLKFERPMHIDAKGTQLYIPQFGKDEISIYDGQKIDSMNIDIDMDAPAGVASYQEETAIADFYHHQIHYFDGKTWKSYGKEGKGEGEFYYPTDVQITDNKIYVADAYNNRVQVFDKSMKLQQIIGDKDGMNASTGVYVSSNEVFVTDFENNRALVYKLDGTLQQTINFLENPTDIIVIDGLLYILNYKGKSISIYSKAV